MDTPERAAQARKLLALAQQVSGADDLSVICGDFNVGQVSETLAILAEAGLTELVTSRGHESTRSSQYPKPGRFADYMLVNRPEAVRRFDVIRDPEVSDHCPLVLTS
ncbi:endonuclease/exonuclease/phosphatase family protein [Litorisediminicola beolgyonensis]|uniref:Endonuclease/exonuclease/phosphatase family protein n=1 Tax=Litorisediminicola beolgyonensis TaxID=1173614 RepID=A0ABW3ZPH9_9RHOB